jgi:hypothetical protein
MRKSVVAGFTATALGAESAGTETVTQSAEAVPIVAATARQTVSIPIGAPFAALIVPPYFEMTTLRTVTADG